MSISKVSVVAAVGGFGALSWLKFSIESRLSCSFLVSSVSIFESLVLFGALIWLKDDICDADEKFCFLNGACLKIFELPWKEIS